MTFEMIIEKNGCISHAKMTSQSNKNVGNEVIDLLNKSPDGMPELIKGNR